MKFSGLGRIGYLSIVSLMAVLLVVFATAAMASSGEGGGVTVVPDSSFIIQMVNFIFLILVLNFILYKPIRKILIQRKEKIQGLELTIETAHKDVEEKNQAFALAIRDARAQGLKEKDVFLQEASGEEQKIIESINQKAQAELVEVRTKIAQEADKARAALQKEIDIFASDISQKILGRAV